MILFSALLPPDDVAESIAAALGAPKKDRLRWEARENWHVTLGYYGHDDPARRTEWLAEQLAGRPAVDVRLENAATFPGVLWLTVAGTELTPLALAAGAGNEGRPYRAHLTLARFPREEPELAEHWVKSLSGYTSRRWSATDVALMSSERGPGGSRYRQVANFELNRA